LTEGRFILSNWRKGNITWYVGRMGLHGS
jgi:hypothetical protein